MTQIPNILEEILSVTLSYTVHGDRLDSLLGIRVGSNLNSYFITKYKIAKYNIIFVQVIYLDLL